MFNTIIWATDGSEHADRALELATQIARANSATLHVVHIVEKLAGGRAAGQDLYYGEDEITTKINRQVAGLQADDGFRTTVQTIPSSVSVAKRLADLARDSSADLIVVGTGAGARSWAQSAAASPSACCTSPTARSWRYHRPTRTTQAASPATPSS
jgi:nucleotide-binding universal stress UspA family protein